MLHKKKVDPWFQVGLDVGMPMAGAVSELTKYLVEDTQLSTSATNKLLIFNTALFYTFLDIQAFVYLDPKNRTSFSDGLLFETVARLSEAFELPVERMDEVGHELNRQMHKLAPYAQQLLAETDKSPKGTLFWEYSKLLNSDYEVETRKALASSLYAPEIAINLWSQIKHLFPVDPLDLN